MESRVKVFGHPIHQVLVFFPLGGFGFACASDVLHAFSGRRGHAQAARLALDYSLVGAAAAVPFGVLDWLAIPARTRAKRVGALHGLGNLAVFGLLAASRGLRHGASAPRSAKLLSAAAVLLSGFTAWLGTELVNRHAVGLDGKLGFDAPSSLAQARGALELNPGRRAGVPA